MTTNSLVVDHLVDVLKVDEGVLLGSEESSETYRNLDSSWKQLVSYARFNLITNPLDVDEGVWFVIMDSSWKK